MIDQKTIDELRNELVEERQKRLITRQEVYDSWERLQEPEREFEETAEKGFIARSKEAREESAFSGIKDIEAALDKISSGQYGRCEACDGSIGTKRLRAIPWAKFCAVCAAAREPFNPGEAVGETVSGEGTGLSDEEMLAAIWDELHSQSESRVDSEELEIICRNGVVYLDGFLPSRREHAVLTSIIKDVLDFNSVVDNVRIDRQLWERRDRTPPPRKTGPGASDTRTSMETGQSMTPPDEMIPEKPE